MSKVTETGTSSDRSIEGDAEKSVDEAATLSPKLVYEVVWRSGQEELHCPTKSLIWLGIAAGSLISFSVLVEVILRTNLSDT